MWKKMLLPKVKGTVCLTAKVHKVKKAGGGGWGGMGKKKKKGRSKTIFFQSG